MLVVKSVILWLSFGWFIDGELEVEGGEMGMLLIKLYFVSFYGMEIDCDVEFLFCVILY